MIKNNNDKLTCSDRKQRVGVWATQDRGLGDSLQSTTREFDLGGSYVGVYFCQNSRNCVHLESMHFIACNLYFNEFYLKGKIEQGKEMHIRGEYQPRRKESKTQRAWRVLLLLVYDFGSELCFPQIFPKSYLSLRPS